MWLLLVSGALAAGEASPPASTPETTQIEASKGVPTDVPGEVPGDPAKDAAKDVAKDLAPIRVTLPPPVVQVTEDPRLAELESRFQLQKLRVEEHKPVPGSFDQSRWAVLDGVGNPITARRFAELVHDDEVSSRISEERDRAVKRGRVLRWTGIGLLALSPVPIFTMRSGESSRNLDRTWTTLAIAATGGFVLGATPMTHRGLVERQAIPNNYYDEGTAEELSGAFNRQLFVDLGLEQARSTSAAPAAPEAPEVPLAPAPATSGAPAETPAAPATAAPPASSGQGGGR